MRILFYIVVFLLPYLEKGGCHSLLRNKNVLAHAHYACPSACLVGNKNVSYVAYLNHNNFPLSLHLLKVRAKSLCSQKLYFRDTVLLHPCTDKLLANFAVDSLDFEIF